jgi:hypothetical protein
MVYYRSFLSFRCGRGPRRTDKLGTDELTIATSLETDMPLAEPLIGTLLDFHPQLGLDLSHRVFST